ncbi:hypothetical protein I5677_08945 [Mobilitalea sibirica]|uniref:Putative Flagellin Flp1-like domain-containing protein n=1 Tax=Mobilitalea sibirica TaxID=1462919 RepID=A0A8J7KT57_9FIRM|nr:Flp1 family type IVb pilin [Mobilitalea sibirica]MBH1941016.1 hypothetical protein [Mobilitalea sibirica]
MKKLIQKLFQGKAEGIGVVEIILILVVLIGLVLIFREQLEALIDNIFKSITGKTSSVIG